MKKRKKLTYLIISLMVFLIILIVALNYFGYDETTDQVGESAGVFSRLKQFFGFAEDDIDDIDDEELDIPFGSSTCPPDEFLFEGDLCAEFEALDECLFEEVQAECAGVMERVLCKDHPDAHLPGDPEATCASMTDNGNENSVQCEGGEGNYEIGFWRCILDDPAEDEMFQEDEEEEEVPVDNEQIIEDIEEILREEQEFNEENEVAMEEGFF